MRQYAGSREELQGAGHLYSDPDWNAYRNFVDHRQRAWKSADGSSKRHGIGGSYVDTRDQDVPGYQGGSEQCCESVHTVQQTERAIDRDIEFSDRRLQRLGDDVFVVSGG